MKPDPTRQLDRVPHGGSTDPDLLDFSANVNPRTPPGVEAVYERALETARRYPDDDYPAYREAASAYVDCAIGDVIPTPGGLAGIRLTMRSLVEPGDAVLVPYPSFGEYAREVRLRGASPTFVPAVELLEADPTGHALAIVCNPNNPTGTAYDDGDLRRFLNRCRSEGTPALVDEAFLGFTDRPSLAGVDGTIVVRSLTKLFGLPGLRAGFVVAPGAVGTMLETHRRTWNLGTTAATVGAHCMGRSEFVMETRECVKSERERLVGSLSERFHVFPSEAPFLLLDVGTGRRDEPLGSNTVTSRARDRGVVVRDASTFRGLDSHVRIAIRDPGENDRLLEVLHDV